MPRGWPSPVARGGLPRCTCPIMVMRVSMPVCSIIRYDFGGAAHALGDDD